MSLRILAFLVVFQLSGFPVWAQSRQVIPVRGGPKISVTVPMGYSFETRVNQDESVLVLLENPVWGIDVQVLMKVDPDPAVVTREWQENKLIQFMAPMMSQSNETDYNFQPLNPVRGTGRFCEFTALGTSASSSGPGGGGTHCTVGLKAWPKFVVVFKIACSSTSTPEYAEVFEILNRSFTP